MATMFYSSDPPVGDPGIATHNPTGREFAAVLDDDDYLWVRPLHDNGLPFKRLTDTQQDRHFRFQPYMADEHGWHCDQGDLDLMCVDCLRDAIAHEDIHGD